MPVDPKRVRDLRATRRGDMDPSGWGMTRVGQVLGAITAWVCIVLVAAFAAGFGGRPAG